MIKHYSKEAFREKFRLYRSWFAIAAALFLCALLAELFLWGDLGYVAESAAFSFRPFCSDLICVELSLSLLAFLSGLTLYAPALFLLTALLRGAVTGFCLSLVIGASSFWLVFLSLLYLVLSAWLQLAYGCFCTVTALQQFSAGKRGERAGERQLFGGSLFCSRYFCGRINLRFLFSYILFFLAAVCALTVTVFAYAALRLLL